MYLNAAAQFLGLSIREAQLQPVGLILDMTTLEQRRRGLSEKN